MKLMMMYKEATFSLFHGPNLTIINWKDMILSSFHGNLDKVGSQLGEGEEEHGVEKHAQDLAGPIFYVEDGKDFFLDILGKDDGAEGNARDGDEDCGKEEEKKRWKT